MFCCTRCAVGWDVWHTQLHTMPVTTPLKAVAIHIQCGKANDVFTVLTRLLLIFLFSLPIYIFTYKHKFSLKITISAGVRNSWEDTIAVLLLWKILTWKCFLCKNAQYVRVFGLRYSLKLQTQNYQYGRRRVIKVVSSRK